MNAYNLNNLLDNCLIKSKLCSRRFLDVSQSPEQDKIKMMNQAPGTVPSILGRPTKQENL